MGGSGASGLTSIALNSTITDILLPQDARRTRLPGAQRPTRTVPLPGSAWLFSSGLVGWICLGRRVR
jgi:hypothetical protein